MSLFHSSSRAKRHTNPDGAIDVHCWNCGCYIGRTYERITSAQCELCRRVELGEPMTEDMVRQYKSAKIGHEDVTMLLLPVETPHGLGKKFSVRSMAGNVMQALGIKQPPPEPTISQHVAKSKQRKRLFESVQLGSVESLDQELNKNKDRS